MQRLQPVDVRRAGRLVLAGPHPALDAQDPGPAGFTGSLVVAEFATREAAIAWAAEDPYVAAGVYAKVTVKPFRRDAPGRAGHARLAAPWALDLRDESAQHAGHAGARPCGGSHWQLSIVSEAFRGKSPERGIEWFMRRWATS